MKIIGLTGSIGMGKSTTANMLRALKIPVHDSDLAVHQLFAKRSAAYLKIAEIFPGSLNPQTGEIDRLKLGADIFADPRQKDRLEKILHPLVRQSQKKFIARMRRMGMKMIVLDIPLLFETRADKRCDYVICATAPPFLQRQRVLKRPRMSEEKFRNILSHQMPDLEKRKRADFTVQTGLGRAHSFKALKKILKRIK